MLLREIWEGEYQVQGLLYSGISLHVEASCSAAYLERGNTAQISYVLVNPKMNQTSFRISWRSKVQKLMNVCLVRKRVYVHLLKYDDISLTGDKTLAGRCARRRRNQMCYNLSRT